MGQRKQVPPQQEQEQEQVPQDADTVYMTREAVLIDEVEALRRARDEAEATITAAQEQAHHAAEGLRCWELALNEYRRRHGRPYDPDVFAAPEPASAPERPRRRPQGEFGRFLDTWAATHGGEVIISEAVEGAGDMLAHIRDPRSRADSLLKRKGYAKVATGLYRAPAPTETSPNGTPAAAAAVVSG